MEGDFFSRDAAVCAFIDDSLKLGTTDGASFLLRRIFDGTAMGFGEPSSDFF